MADQGGSSSAADSYIGSLISLTSKSEIRYEGVLYTVDTENSNIALQNVRSYGTEGRKKDGPQIPASEKVYDYIVFRGKDIKDLQVKSGPAATAVAAPPAPPVDPAIVSMPSHYPQAPAAVGPAYPAPRRAPPVAETTAPGAMLYSGAPASTIQQGAAPPPYPTAWGPTPPAPAANGSTASMPQPWQGYYRGPTGHDPLQPGQTSRPPQQPVPLVTPPTLLGSTGFPSQPHLPSGFLPSDPATLNAASGTASTFSQHGGIAPAAAVVTPAAKWPRRVPAPQIAVAQTAAPVQPSTQQETSTLVAPTSSQEEKPRDMTVNPGTSQPVLGHPLLPLPSTPPQKQRQGIQGGYRGAGRPTAPAWPGSNVLQSAGNRRGGGRGMRMGGRGIVQPTGQTQQFTEDFDFTAMNEKFKKEEVWGELGGGSTKAEEKDDEAGAAGEVEEERNADENEDGALPVPSGEASTQAKKASPVYDKDDFFDTISCDSLDREHGGQRSRFSEQRKVDIETFGHAQMRRGGRGGRGGRRGGGGYRGGYGYGGYGGLGKQAPHHYGMQRNMEPNRGRGGGLPHNL